ncbi:hypothetical protein SDC9_122785 [bioreactor metagenome]|uniref:Uncharacterized protein n=1 Tax=bioreactor metagenome TaxID=1076179 RepID=A0A645CFW9_9ZZZZ
MHGRADAVPGVLAHDAQPASRMGGRCLDGGTDIAHPLGGRHRRDTVPHGFAGDLDQVGGLGSGPATDDEGSCRVTVPAVQDRTEIHRDDVTLGEPAVAGDAVHDLFVHRDAHGRRVGRDTEIGAVVQERTGGAVVAQHRAGDGVEVGGADTGPRRLPHGDECLCHHQTGLAHGLDLFGGFDLDAA